MTLPTKSLYAGHQFSPEVISHVIWLYFRFPLSLHMVEEMLAAEKAFPPYPLHPVSHNLPYAPRRAEELSSNINTSHNIATGWQHRPKAQGGAQPQARKPAFVRALSAGWS